MKDLFFEELDDEIGKLIEEGAKAGVMPEGLTQAGILLFLSLRLIYGSFRKGMIDEKAGRREKERAVSEYRKNRLSERCYAGEAKRRARMGALMAEARKAADCPRCMRFVQAIDGK